MATHNPTTLINLASDTPGTVSPFELQARLDGFLDSNGYFVGPPDDFELDISSIEAPMEIIKGN